MDKVLVIGGINLDIKAKTLAAHVPATSNPSTIISKPGGVGRNIAHNLAALGIPVSLLGVVGRDAQGDAMLAATKAVGVDISAVIKREGSTGIYLAVLDQSGELVTAASDMAILDHLTPEMIARNNHLIAEASYVVVDCNLPLATMQAVAALAGDRLIVEPVSVSKSQKLRSLLKNQRIFLATPNLDQVQALTRVTGVEPAAKILKDMGLVSVVIHHGANGALVYDGSIMHHVPSEARNIVDVTGAGDAATAGLVAGLMRGLSLPDSAKLGQTAAAQVIASEFSTLVGP